MPTTNETIYDCGIIGGGLAGLCLAIQLAQKNHSVVLFERNTFPFHKVCGEYISMESWNFIEQLGIPLSKMNLPKISTLNVSAPNGFVISSKLDLGGFGISRYTLDFELVKIAKQHGVVILENHKVTNVLFVDVNYIIEANDNRVSTKLVFGSYGKINPSFIERKKVEASTNYIGVKYHIKTKFPNDLIELHNFENGYCGISKIDNETYCLCYLTTAKKLKENNNNIKLLEQNVLMQNPFLKKYFSESEFLFSSPLAISNISFQKKKTYNNHCIMLGDAAGTIAPLCGNGMSMAMRTSTILAKLVSLFLQNKIPKQELLKKYNTEWNQNFAVRTQVGYYLQLLFGNKTMTLVVLKFLSYFPWVFKKFISLTHGKPF